MSDRTKEPPCFLTGRIYCICGLPAKNVSLRCDNDNCAVKWYHLEHVEVAKEAQDEDAQNTLDEKSSTTRHLNQLSCSNGMLVQKLSPIENSSSIANSDRYNKDIRDIWQYYTDNTTLHGIRYVGDEVSLKYRRAIWGLFVLLMGAMLLMWSIDQLMTFFEYPTVTKQFTQVEFAPQFPAVTICNFNKIRNSSVSDSFLREILIQSFVNIPSNISYLKTVDRDVLSSIDLSKLFLNGVPDLSETFVSCSWEGRIINCTDYFLPVLTNDGYCARFNSRQFSQRNGGRLRTGEIGSPNGLVVTLFAKQDDYLVGDSAAAGFKVLVHEPDVEPSMKEDGVSVSLGSSTFVAVEKTELTYLPSPVKAFTTSECVEINSPEFSSPLTYFDSYSFDACITECRAKYIAKTCDCKDIFDPGDIAVCDPLSIVTCVKEASGNFSHFGIETCTYCPIPCHHTLYDVVVSTAWFPRNKFVESLYGSTELSTEYLRNNMAEVRVYYRSKFYMKLQQVREMTNADIIASIGGYMGMFLGASFNTLLEFFEVCWFSSVVCVRHRLNK